MAASRQDLVAQVGGAIQHYQRSSQSFDDAVGRRLGLNPADLRCLDWLVDGPKTAGQLSAATGIRPAATTAMIDRLVRKGFVRRVDSDRDRRQVLVEMTPEGHARTGELYGPLAREGERVMSSFTLEQLEHMRDVLVTIREITDEHRQRIAGGT